MSGQFFICDVMLYRKKKKTLYYYKEVKTLMQDFTLQQCKAHH